MTINSYDFCDITITVPPEKAEIIRRHGEWARRQAPDMREVFEGMGDYEVGCVQLVAIGLKLTGETHPELHNSKP